MRELKSWYDECMFMDIEELIMEAVGKQLANPDFNDWPGIETIMIEMCDKCKKARRDQYYRVIRLYEHGYSYRQIAQKTGLHYLKIYRIMKQNQKNAS